MTLLAPRTNTEVIPEYEKSLFGWKGSERGKQFTPTPVKLTTVKERQRRAHTPAPVHAPCPHTPTSSTSSPTDRCGPPLSSASTSSTLSSLTALSSGSAAASPAADADASDMDACLRKEEHLGSDSGSTRDASFSTSRSSSVFDDINMTRDASPSPSRSVQDALDVSETLLILAAGAPSKRVRDAPEPVDDVGQVAVDVKEEDASLKPSPPKRAKKLKDENASVRSHSRATTASPSASADTSRASSPSPFGKPTGSKKSTSPAAADGTAKKSKRRKKRALTDLTLPPKKGTYHYQYAAPVMVRNASTPRSTTACESDTNAGPDKKPCHRECWARDDGYVRYFLRTSEDIVRNLAKIARYVTFFRNPNDPNDGTYDIREYPTVDLEYPNTGARESFLLLRPKDEDHYDPTMDIEDTLKTFIKDIIPPEYKSMFGPLPEDALNSIIDSDDDDMSDPPPMQSGYPSPSHIPQTPASSTIAGLPSDTDYAPSPPSTSSSRGSPSPRGLMKTLVSARNRKDGPTYTATLREINRCIRELKNRPSDHPSGVNILAQVPYTWSTEGIPRGVVFRIIEETYQRCVGPQIKQLRNYEAFSSNVYGELTPTFIDDIIEKTHLGPDSIFLDLGSGVGNVVLQVALQTGCFAYGIEERKDTATIAQDQYDQIQLRCRMWGVSMGEIELEQGDMMKSARVDELMSKADVVLVNNYVFSEELNAALRPKFLDLKEGAIIVSLKPFAPPNAQMLTERNFDDISAIFDVYSYPYHSGTVSWSGGNGMYYIHHVNREGYRRNREAFENLRRGTRRGLRR